MTDVKELRDLIERLRELADHIGSAQYNADPWASSPSAQANSCRQAASALQSLVDRNEKMEEALKKIERWFGEFPPSGRVWPGSAEPMSYGAAFGSNGERDYMREVARSALPPEDQS